jgi:hypothetical protein
LVAKLVKKSVGFSITGIFHCFLPDSLVLGQVSRNTGTAHSFFGEREGQGLN